MPERLSVLLPVWAGDRPDFLTTAFESTVDDQTRPPDQVVIVRDGPVGDQLAGRITELAAASSVPVDVLALDQNVGLGPALDAGLAACRHPIVARMDADDISLPHRFAVQLPIIYRRRGHRRVRTDRVRRRPGRGGGHPDSADRAGRHPRPGPGSRSRSTTRP